VAALLLVVALFGISACGGGSGSAAESPRTESPRNMSETEPEKVQTVDIALSSTAVKDNDRALELSPPFVCKSGDFPPLKWSNVPKGASELTIFALPLEGTEGANEFGGAIAGIDPAVRGIAAGEIPGGAVVGKNSEGKEDFSLCPSSSEEQFVITIIAPEKPLEPEDGFDPEQVRNEALAASEHSGLLLFTAPKK
jgi:phosphatidylethanolamine-binding protein (PEBP) family uncharacterized protein